VDQGRFLAGEEVTRVTTPTTAAGDELLALHRSGSLAAGYPLVAGLLTGMSDDELQRAGRLLSRVDADTVLAEHPGQRAVTVALTGSGTLAGLLAPLTAETARHGLLLRPVVDDFNGYVFSLSDSESEIRHAEPDVVVCLLDPFTVTDELPVPWTVEDVERVLAEKTGLIERLVARFTAANKATLVVNTFPLPHELSSALVDHRSRARLSVAWREAMIRLLRLTESHPSVVVLDLDPLVAEGLAVTEPRLAVYAKAHLSAELLARCAREVGHVVRQAAGLTKKCLVVDLDQTLWDGVLAEDGPDGIEVGEGHRGEAFTAFQKVVKQIGAQGILLAAVSKNDHNEVRQVFRQHPGMVLREDDFVQITANWRPKHENLQDLAAVLNLDTDSFVFADDSPYERGLVRRELPGVAVVDLDDEPALHIRKLLHDGWFSVREMTDEDLTRGEKYRQEVVRKDFLNTFSSLDDYLRELEVTVHLGTADSAQVARISQMSLRTNQFNLTTRRLQQQDVAALLSGVDTAVFTVRTSDRFGDNGIVGVVFYRREGDLAWIDNFLLSCRVFSRGIEQACLAAVLRYARSTGARDLRALYRPSAKNQAVSDFYPRYGFTVYDRTAEQVVFRHDLAELTAVPEHVRFTDDFERIAP
jgi:FkbH-like protein